jgi:hypothetical protein
MEEWANLSQEERVEAFRVQQRKRLAELVLIDIPCMCCGNRGFYLEEPEGNSIRCKTCNELVEIIRF